MNQATDQQQLHGRYQIARVLGEGAHGTVLVAQDKQLGRPVAIKRLHPHLVMQLGERFEREAQALARISHPHVIEIYDRFVQDGAHYLVTAYADGGSLAAWLAQPGNAVPLPIDTVVAIGLSLAAALHAAHAAGVIHRDVKPSNILLVRSAEGLVVKLADFGVALLTERGTDLTQTGQWVGTPAWLAPEQVRGQPAAAASDVHALGALLYRLLANRHYLALSDDEVTRMQQIASERPAALESVRPAVPAWLAALIAAMLVKDPAARPDAATVYQRLQAGDAPPAAAAATRVAATRVQHARGVDLPVRTRRGARRLLLIVLLLAVALGGGVGALLTLTDLAWPAVTLPPDFDVTAWWTRALSETGLAPAVAPTPTRAPVFAVVSGTAPARGLRLRAEPGTDAEILAVLPDGTLVEVLAFRDFASWAQVAAPDGAVGWVFGGYLVLE